MIFFRSEFDSLEVSHFRLWLKLFGFVFPRPESRFFKMRSKMTQIFFPRLRNFLTPGIDFQPVCWHWLSLLPSFPSTLQLFRPTHARTHTCVGDGGSLFFPHTPHTLLTSLPLPSPPPSLSLPLSRRSLILIAREMKRKASCLGCSYDIHSSSTSSFPKDFVNKKPNAQWSILRSLHSLVKEGVNL